MATNTAMELTADGAGSPRAGELFIAAIGAGAGGGEALTAFFGQVMPGSGFAFVVMMQDPARSPAGMLAAISPLPVSEVIKSAEIQADHIYILSPVHALQLQDGRIVVTGHARPDEQSDPIDAFFYLLAESYGERAASVVLSGTELTATTGLKRTKERGGAVLVQDPREALHPDMPRRAIASGFSNGAFPAADIPAQLVAHAQQTAAKRESPSCKPRLNMGALHHQLLEYYAPPSVVIDAADDVLHLSPQAGRYLRIAGEPSRNLLALVHPELRRDLQKACNQARQDGMNVEIRNLQVRMENRLESLTIHVRPVREEGESASLTQGFMLVLFERTDESVGNPVTVLAAEPAWILEERDQARRLAANLQALLDASPAFIGLFKPVHADSEPNRINDFVLAVGNRRLSEYVGVPLDRLTGRHAAEFGELLWGADTMHILREVYAGAQTRYDEKAVMREGEEHWTGVSVSKRDDGVVLTGLDITALKQAQNQQQFWLRELEKSSESAQALATLRMALQERGELLRSASHDLRGHVGVIASATHLLGMAGTEANSGILIQMIRRNIQQMTHLMTSLLDYSRLEAGHDTIQVSRFNVGEVLQELIDGLEPHAGERGLWLRSSGPDILEVETDPVQIRRIVQNLLLNALKYTKTGGATVSWQLLGKVPGWQLDVSDTGPGLSSYQLGRLRDEPQAALEAGRARRVGSEGIGLSIVKQLCKMLGGRLIVESELGKGTVFTIRFDGSSGPDMA